MTYTEPLILVCALIALVGLARRRRAVAAAGVLALLALSWPPLDWLFALPLEFRYSKGLLPASSAEAIVVVLSSVQPPEPGRPYAIPDEQTYERCAFAVWLYQHWTALPILICGGPPGSPISPQMRQTLEQSGIPPAMIWTEERSSSTHENAVFGAEVLRSHGISRIALVVDAQSMPRAAACFRKQGMTVVPAASSHREWGPLRDELIPNWTAIQRNENTLHEAVGLAWYRLRGWI